MYVFHILLRTFDQFQKDSRVLRTIEAIRELGQSQAIVIYDIKAPIHKIINIKKLKIFLISLHSSFIPDKYNWFNFILSKNKEVSKIRWYIIRFLYWIYFLPLYKYKVKKLLKKEQPGISYCNDFETLFAGIWYKKNYGKKLIYDSHEYWSETLKYKGWRIIFKPAVKLKEKKYIKYCDKVITVSNEIADSLSYDYNIKKPEVIYNITVSNKKLKESKNFIKNKFNLDRQDKIFIYAGGLMPHRGIEFICKNINFLPLKWKFVFLGSGIFEQYIKQQVIINKQRIFYLPSVSPDKMLSILSSAHLGINFMNNVCKNHSFALPNKFWQYISAEIPVISTDLISIKSIINKYKIGEVFPENNVDAFIEFSGKLLSNYNFYKKNIKKIKKIYNWDHEIDKIKSIVKNI